MKTLVHKAVLASMAALTLVAGVVATETPALAGQWHGGGGGFHGGGWHGGGGGWHGGGWHGGGWHGGGWGGYGGGWGWGPAIVGGLAAGALIAGSAACNQAQPIYDAYGNYLGTRWVWVC